MLTRQTALFASGCLAILVCIAAVGATLVICPKCGYENEQGKSTCVHCEAKLPAIAQDASSTNADDVAGVSGRIKYLDPKIVEEEITMAQSQLDSKDPLVARHFLKNATALDMITDLTIKNDRADRITGLVRKCEEWKRFGQEKCPVCGGKGTSVMKIVDLKGKVSTKELGSVPCVKCEGHEYLVRGETIDELRANEGKASGRYVKLQRKRKFVAIGNAWVPANAEFLLSLKQRIILKRMTAAPCGQCLGTGAVDCLKCKRIGQVKCTGDKCVRGMVEVPMDKVIVETKIWRTEKCKICNGTGMVQCVDCKGMGGIVCKTCNGTGERPACAKCNGQGYTACATCRGSGRVGDAPCTACGGERIAECSVCNGSGREK